MRIINKKYLLIILLVGILLTGVIVLKPKENIKLDEVILKQEVNNKTFAMYKEEGKSYVPVEGTKFPEMYVLNLTESKCIDNNGNEIKDALSYENDEVVLTTNKSSYCYLYFDKSLGLEIKEKNPNRLSEEEKGAMYRFQGQQTDDVRNYICFGTSDKEDCVKDTDKYMYRIIGIEAETGRIKVIKKEALEQTYQWWNNNNEDIKWPDSLIYQAINGADFLDNTTYIPEGWKDKISDNTWIYGDMIEGVDANQIGEELYKTESGEKEASWWIEATEDDGVASQVTWGNNIKYPLGTTVYSKLIFGKWEGEEHKVTSKISLMYLHDYYFSVGDNVNCQYSAGEETYGKCALGWIHINNDEYTMSREGWDISAGGSLSFVFRGDIGCSYMFQPFNSTFIRPVFFINASEELLSGTGTITDPFMIKQ